MVNNNDNLVKRRFGGQLCNSINYITCDNGYKLNIVIMLQYLLLVWYGHGTYIVTCYKIEYVHTCDYVPYNLFL